LASAYWQGPDKLVPISQDGFRNGDLARRDDEGYVYITGRKKDIIIKGGVNIASLEITNCLLEHPDVADAGTLGVRDDINGAVPEHAQPQARTAASWRALIVSFLGWMFDGYETYALSLVAGVALRQLRPPDQLASIPIYIGGLLAVTLVGWATGGIIAGVLADYIGRKRMLMLSILWHALFTGLTAFAGSYTSLLILRFLTGLGLGAEWGPGTAILGE